MREGDVFVMKKVYTSQVFYVRIIESQLIWKIKTQEVLMKTAIMTDTNSGILMTEAEENHVFVLPMPVIMDEQVFFDVIYSENDNMAYGAIDALKKEGLQPGEDVTIVSFDAGSTALHMILSGEISFDVECNPLHGPRVRTIIEQLEKGNMPPKFTFVEEAVFEKEGLTEKIINERGY